MNKKKIKHNFIENYLNREEASNKRMNGDTLNMEKRVRRIEITKAMMIGGNNCDIQ